MVEGPTAKAYTIRINREFSGEIVNNIFVKSKRIFIPLDTIVKKEFLNSDSIGKNILFFFDDVVIRVHLMMYGAIHIYEISEPLLKPERQVKILIEGEKKKLVVYNAPIIEIDRKDRILERLRNELGPDPLSKEWNKEKAIQNILKFKDEKIGVVLLNQSAIAGIGNILRNEILFKAGISPERKIKDLTIEEIEKIVNICEEISKEFLRLKVERKKIGPILYVYNRYRGKCKICGSELKFYLQEPIKRKTFVCPKCQK